jgi:hypothetical protein
MSVLQLTCSCYKLDAKSTCARKVNPIRTGGQGEPATATVAPVWAINVATEFRYRMSPRAADIWKNSGI